VEEKNRVGRKRSPLFARRPDLLGGQRKKGFEELAEALEGKPDLFSSDTKDLCVGESFQLPVREPR